MNDNWIDEFLRAVASRTLLKDAGISVPKVRFKLNEETGEMERIDDPLKTAN